MKHFGKGALIALLATMLIGTAVSCSDEIPQEEREELVLRSIAVTSPPAKTVYAKGQALDLTGLVVAGTYADGSTKTETVSASNVTGYDKDRLGEQPLTVTVNGKTATFSVKHNSTFKQTDAFQQGCGEERQKDVEFEFSARGGDCNDKIIRLRPY